MPRSTSRVLKHAPQAGRPLTKEEILLRVLNGNIGSSGKPLFKAEVNVRLLQLLIYRFQRLEAKLKAEKYLPDESYDPFSENPEVEKAFFALNRLLVRYTLTPRVLPDYQAVGSRLGWEMSYGEARKRQEFFEFARVRQIERIAAQGRISYLKQCANCKQWLFAKFSHQRFCSELCKEEFHKSDDADKMRRRDWARRNYWLHKNKNTK